MIGYFDELSAALARGEADPDVLTRIADRYGMDVIGPVPEGTCSRMQDRGDA